MEYINGEAVLEDTEPLELLILDIEMPGISGIEVKNELQRRKSETFIIYVTFYDNYMKDAFGVRVNGFVNKRDLEKELPKMLERTLRFMEKHIRLDNGIDSKDILYIRSDHVYVNIVLRNGDCIVSRNTLSELEEKLSCVDFVKTHKSYLVNLQWARGWKENYVILQNDFADVKEEVPVARREKERVKQMYHDYTMERHFG